MIITLQKNATNQIYCLNIQRDVDSNGDDGFILNLPAGYKFDDEDATVRGFDTMRELRFAAKHNTVTCS